MMLLRSRRNENLKCFLHLAVVKEIKTKSKINALLLFPEERSFHLSTLEASFIKILQPNLCRQKKFVYIVQIFY